MQTRTHVLLSASLLSLSSASFAASFGDDGRTFKGRLFGSTTTFERCTDDQIISADDAKARADWAYRCQILDPAIWETEFTGEWSPVKKQYVPLPAGKRRYPIFVKNQPGFPIWHPNHASCDLPPDVEFYDVCMNGCYRGDQRIAFSQGYEPIAKAATQDKGKLKVLTLDPRQASFERPVYRASAIDYFVQSGRDAKEELLTLRTPDGSLTVTKDHPLLDADGYMVMADSLHTGDSLVRADGSLSPIQEKSYEDFFGKVYNLAPAADDALENVVIAEGFLNGSHRYQAGRLSALEDVVLKRSIDLN